MSDGITAASRVGTNFYTAPPGGAKKEETEGLLQIHHLPVGNGDATLIVGPDGTTILIDGGKGNKAKKEILDALDRLNIKRLDWVVVTHNHSDHVGAFANSRGDKAKSVFWGPDGVPGNLGDDDGKGGVDWISNAGPCGQLGPDPGEITFPGSDDIYPTKGVFYNGDGCKDYKSILFRRFLGIIYAKEGIARPIKNYEALRQAFEQPIKLGDGAQARIVVANGWVFNNSTRVVNADSQNERSIGLYIEYKGFDYLVSGDLIGQKHGTENAWVEGALAAALLTIADSPKGDPTDVFQVNHHGALNATNKKAVGDLQPGQAIITVGTNSHGHPALETLLTLAGFLQLNTIFMTNTPSGKKHGPAAFPSDYTGRTVPIIISNAPVVITTDGITYTIEAQGGKYKQMFKTDDQ